MATHKLGTLETYICDQDTDEWRQLRLGIPTASCFSDVMAGGGGKVRDLYMRKLVGEIISGQPRIDFVSAAMQRGKDQEATLREEYQIITGHKVELIGFGRRTFDGWHIGASPDGLVGEDRLVEIKKADPHVLIELLESDRFPMEHWPQVQGQMLVFGRLFCDLVVGYPGMPQFRRTVKRDDGYCAVLQDGVANFNRQLLERVERIKRYRSA